MKKKNKTGMSAAPTFQNLGGGRKRKGVLAAPTRSKYKAVCTNDEVRAFGVVMRGKKTQGIKNDDSFRAVKA